MRKKTQGNLAYNLKYLEVSAADIGDIHVVSGRTDILVLLVGKNVQTHHVDLGVAVLASL